MAVFIGNGQCQNCINRELGICQFVCLHEGSKDVPLEDAALICCRSNCSEHLLWQTSSLELADVWSEWCRDLL